MIIVNDRDKVAWRENMTVQALLDQMNYRYSLITVTVNGELVPKEDYQDHLIPDNASVTVFHLAHGG
jgi:sulfur carrier protein